MPAAVADAVNDVLAGVQEPGGFGYSAGLALSQTSAGKTGTINGNRAVWFVGYTPNLSTAAMLAGANSQGHWITLNGQYVGGQYISRAFGSSYAGPIWAGAMQTIDDFLPDAEFTDPDPTAISGRPVAIPSVSGLEPPDAAMRLREAGFLPDIGSYVRSSFAKGMVSGTDPVAGATLGTGSPVTIHVSNGRQPRGGGDD
jgi:membrane peptidoglycan carboxypeptidase